MSSSDAQASPERCRCDAYEVPNRSGALFPGDGKVHTWPLCQPIAGRVSSRCACGQIEVAADGSHRTEIDGTSHGLTPCFVCDTYGVSFDEPLTPDAEWSGRTLTSNEGTAMSGDCQEWSCPKLGCDLDADGHDLALAMEHIYEIEPEAAQGAADRTIKRMEGLL